MILGADLNSRVQSGMRPLLVINIVSQPPASSSVPPQHEQCCCSLGMSIENDTRRWVPCICCAVQCVPSEGADALKLSDLQDVQDSHEEAARVAPQALKLCRMVCHFIPQMIFLEA